MDGRARRYSASPSAKRGSMIWSDWPNASADADRQRAKVVILTLINVRIVSRRQFLQTAAICGSLRRVAASAGGGRPTLHNGITLADPWPPRMHSFSEAPTVPPYLHDPPDVIPIDVGRQLFVDDFLIEESTLHRTYYQATYHRDNPVLQPDQPWERRDDVADRTHQPRNPAAMVFSDGVFWDPREQLFKMWYMGGYDGATCLALSQDGVSWERPRLDVVSGTNIVRPGIRDSNTVWLDLEAPAASRYKMAWFDGSEGRLLFALSPDGIHWEAAGRSSPIRGDRSTIYYDVLRRVWVFSLRDADMPGYTGRFRRYWETDAFPPRRPWRTDEPVLWIAADRLDAARPEYGQTAQIYNLDAVAYESLLLGLFTMWRGERPEREKPNDVVVGYSRDGFHWWRPDRQPFIGVSERPGDWNWANVQSAGGCCVVVGDRLHFYVSGRQGRPGSDRPGVCSTGLATLRRDGFASMDDRYPPGSPTPASGTIRQLTTRPVRFSGSHLWVNADIAPAGALRVEVLDAQGRVIQPFSAANAQPIGNADRTRMRVSWSTGEM